MFSSPIYNGIKRPRMQPKTPSSMHPKLLFIAFVFLLTLGWTIATHSAQILNGKQNPPRTIYSRPFVSNDTNDYAENPNVSADVNEPPSDPYKERIKVDYKVPPKKTIDELRNLDANDESLKKWKQSLGIMTVPAGPKGEPQKVVITSFAIAVHGKPDTVLDISSKEKIESLKNRVIVVKEGINYDLKINFRIQHDIALGLQYSQSIKREGVQVDTTKQMIGSYAPRSQPYNFTISMNSVPSGPENYGIYQINSKFFDDDKATHLEFSWQVRISRDWS